MTLNARFLEALQSRQPVTGYTHDFYRYPARFSPLFAREAIRAFTKPGDVVLDAFMGGGTSLVEARAEGRHAVGTDISSLAVFLAETKTALLGKRDLRLIHKWAGTLEEDLNLHRPVIREIEWIEMGYQRNINSRTTWPVRKSIELALARVTDLPEPRQQKFARCLLLKTAQWALDCRAEVPTATELRQQLKTFLDDMTRGAEEYARVLRRHPFESQVSCLRRSAVGLESEKVWKTIGRPKLIITSPPYPGVHVLYHRWQIQGRRETPAPFWIAGTLDGHGSSFYTFGDRQQHNLTKYYDQARAAFRSLAELAHKDSMLVQLVGFSDPKWQLPDYLGMMTDAGFTEIRFKQYSGASDGRLWRSVPNRKWYATQRGEISASKEVVLFHRLALSY
jgi:DNA methylase